MRIGLFGGSFDPPHNGHLSIISQALNCGLVDEVWLIPTFENPWKKEEAAPTDRLQMCNSLAGKKVKILDIEIKREGLSYTIETILEIKKKYQGEFFWLLGNDHLENLKSFKNAEKLLKEVIFIGFPRTEVSSSEIKERVKLGKSISGMVSPRVEEYIKEHGLYK